MKTSRPARVRLGLSAFPLLLVLGSCGQQVSLTPGISDRTSFDRFVAAGGLVEPVSEVRELSATVVGRINAVHVEEGDFVSSGAMLAEIENGDLRAALAGARAEQVARENELARLQEGARPQEIEAARAELREAEAAMVATRTIFDRRHSLGERNVVSAEDVDQARADRDTAEARHEQLQQRYLLLTAPPREEDVAIASANLEAARARVAQIEAELEKTFIRSPIDGIVLKLHRRSGESVTNLPPTLIATVGDIRRLRVRADFDEIDVSHIALGQSVLVSADAYPGEKFHGIVSRIGEQLGPKNFRTNDPRERIDTNVLEVIIDLEPGVRLPVGLPVDVTLAPTEENESLSQEGPYRLRGSLVQWAETETIDQSKRLALQSD